ncbi:hypothetical protein ZOSMA_71G00110 [Zostera marina]|uniref:Uncharacterized protein n=1 Tax=Zostera marina TaxID=29655 RepID=A0A0K9NQQ6_ZOSMR|nr:hypothetical protein ZOSMA_71G00110 [Zostera marina]
MPLSITGKKCTHRPPTSRSYFSRLTDDELPKQSTLPITFSNNKLTGCIPEDIGFTTNMEVLDFNSFTGHLPTSISCLSDIQVFNIAHNQISGVFPDVVCSMRSLMNLTISFNFFSGFSHYCTKSFQGFDFSENFSPILPISAWVSVPTP